MKLKSSNNFVYGCARALTFMVFFAVPFSVFGQDKEASDASAKIAIIGNSELPEVGASLAWRVPDGGSRGEEDSKPVDMPSTGTVIDIKTHKRQIYFEKHLEIDVNRFNKR